MDAYEGVWKRMGVYVHQHEPISAPNEACRIQDAFQKYLMNNWNQSTPVHQLEQPMTTKLPMISYLCLVHLCVAKVDLVLPFDFHRIQDGDAVLEDIVRVLIHHQAVATEEATNIVFH